MKRLPALAHGAQLFDSCHGLWALYESEAGVVLTAADTKTRRPRSCSRVSSDYSTAEVWLDENASAGRRGWLPMHLLNPLAEVCLVTRVGREGGLLLHASGALLEEEGWAFTGPSGAGKSTLADLLAGHGADVLSDERLIIRRDRDGFVLYGTPWVGAGRHARNQSGRLTRLFCIRHGQGRHVLAGMTRRGAGQWVLQQTFLPHWDRAALQGTLDAVGDLVERIEPAELAFLKERTVVPFLRSHRPWRQMGAA